MFFLGLSSSLVWRLNNASFFALLILPVIVWAVFGKVVFGAVSAVIMSAYGAVFIVTVLHRPSALPYFAIVSFVLITVGVTVGILSGLYERVKSQEARLEDLAREERVARDSAIAANQAKNDFLSAMSHELRTPLNAILGFGQILQADTALNDEQSEFAGEIIRAGEHLLSLVDEVLDLSRIETGRVDLSLEPVAVASVFSEVVTLIAPFAEKEGIRLIVEEAGVLAIHADRVRLKQVLINLLSNAIKYNRPGGTVALHATCRHGTVRISVADTGEGIPPEQVKDLFTRFNRLGREKGSIEGTGIGLALSKRLVELMNGTITAESVPGTGSTFLIELPGCDPLPDAFALDTLVANAVLEGGRRPDRVEPPEQPDVVEDDDRITVLYVEDNPAGIRLMNHILGKESRYRLITAHTGSLGLDMAELHRPQVVLVDINLPGIDGFEILRRIRATEWGASVPVIAISANAMKHSMKSAEAAGFTSYITKPFDINEFLELLSRVSPPGVVGDG